MDRMYLKRDRLGRGLTCLVEKAELMLLNLHDFLSKNPKTRALAEHERNEASHLGLIHEYLQAKYGLTNSDINQFTMKCKHQEVRLSKIQEKRMHRILFMRTM